MSDLHLVCADCGEPFVYTVAEQAFFAARALAAPKRCRACRQARRRSASGRAPAFPAEERTRTRPTSGGLSGEYHTIRCNDCGAIAHVPFRPLPRRPVYCPECYRARKGVLAQATDGLAVDEDDEGIIE